MELISKNFIKHVKHTVEFTNPTAKQRQKLWRSFLPPAVPLAENVDFKVLANDFVLSGGNIKYNFLLSQICLDVLYLSNFFRKRNACFAACSREALKPSPQITMKLLIEAARVNTISFYYFIQLRKIYTFVTGGRNS